MKKTPVDVQKTVSRKNHACPKMSGGLSLRAQAFPHRNIGLAFRQDREQVGVTAGWLGTWDSPLRTDSASLKISRIIQTTNLIV